MRTTSLALLAAAVGLALLTACAGTPDGPQLPSWVRQPASHPEAPDSLVFSAVGSAPGSGGGARELAHDRALTSLSRALTVEVSSVLELDSRSRQENGETTWTDELVERARIAGSEDLPGVRQVAAHHDPGLDETHVLLVVRRDLLRDGFLEQVAQGLQVALSANERADAMRASAPGRSLLARLEAWQAASEAYQAAARARVAGDRDRPSSQAFSRASDLQAAIQGLLSEQLGSLRFVRLAGDGQPGHPRGALAQRLLARLEVVHADGSSESVPDLPVRFRCQDGLAQLAASASTTDVRGEISCSVSDLARAEHSVNEIRVELDASALAPDLPAALVPGARFTYRLPSPGSTRLLVSLADTYEGRPLQTPLAASVIDQLSERGFHVQGQADISGGAAELRERFGDTFDYVLRGGARVERGSLERSLQYLHLRADIEVVALATGQVFSVGVEATGAGRDDGDGSASQAVTRYLVAPLLEQLDERFVADFVPDDPSSGGDA